MQSIDAIVFDLGGVLIDWNPRYLYRSLFDGDEHRMEVFLSTICTPAWNNEQDSGRLFADAVALLKGQYPEHAEYIEAYDRDWHKMLGEAIADNLQLLAELRQMRMPLYALSNWSAEKFPIALHRFEFLSWFDGMVVSGHVGMKKPDPKIFRHLLDRFRLSARRTLFIDDSPDNGAAAAELGFVAVHYQSPAQLRESLASLDLCPASD